MPLPQVMIAGAGIGGLVCALALARRGFPVKIFESAQHLQDAGAGIQLSPNATRILFELGCGDQLPRCATAPREVRVINGIDARVVARIPLGETARRRYGAPYWAVHRGDLMASLAERIHETGEIDLRLRTKLENFVVDDRGITVRVAAGKSLQQERGAALIGADGVWSVVRMQQARRLPRFCGQTAWRTLIDSGGVPPHWREPVTSLWLGPDAHLVHYSLRTGAAINIVAILPEHSSAASPQERGSRHELLARFNHWHPRLRELLSIPEHWSKWPLFESPPPLRSNAAPVTLVGDAAHAMLPFIAQGGAMAIEDAAVLAECLGRCPHDLSRAFIEYEQLRHRRTLRVLRHARHNGMIYHFRGPLAFARNLVLRSFSGERLLARYDWLYGWRQQGGV